MGPAADFAQDKLTVLLSYAIIMPKGDNATNNKVLPRRFFGRKSLINLLSASKIIYSKAEEKLYFVNLILLNAVFCSFLSNYIGLGKQKNDRVI